MNERELLERCAKVMGVTGHIDHHGVWTVGSYEQGGAYWNPIDSVADAADMAIKLKVDVRWRDDKSGCIADAYGIRKTVVVSLKDHPTEQAAYCYAVCSVVAQMGEMK